MEACRLKQVVQRWDPEHGFAWPLRLCYCLVWNPVHDPAQARTEAGGLSGGKNRATVDGRWWLTHLDLRTQLGGQRALPGLRIDTHSSRDKEGKGERDQHLLCTFYVPSTGTKSFNSPTTL